MASLAIKSNSTENQSLVQKQPLTGCEKVGLIVKLALWSITSLGTFFLADYPKQRVVEIWTQLTASDDLHDERGYGSVMTAPPLHCPKQDLLAVFDHPAYVER